MAIMWNGYEVEEVKETSLTDDIKRLFCGVKIVTLGDNLPELMNIKDGYYVVKEVNEYFMVKSNKQYGEGRDIYFPMRRNGVIESYLNKLYERKYEEKLGTVMAEVVEFDNDLYNELVFTNGIAKMKNYYNRELSVKIKDDGRISLYLNGKFEIEIEKNKYNKYCAYEGYSNNIYFHTIKEAVKSYMDNNFKYPTDSTHREHNCSACGDGGCVHCEPHRFIRL